MWGIWFRRSAAKVVAEARRNAGNFVTKVAGEVAPCWRVIAPLAAAGAVWGVWVSGPSASGAALALLGAVGGALGVIDARTHRLPNVITYPATAGVALLLAAAAALTGDDYARLLRASVGAVTLGSAYLLLHLANRSGLGLGDVKLAVLLGLAAGWSGWGTVWWAGALPFLLGGLAALALIVVRRASRNTALAFGPWMLAGFVLALTCARLLGA